MRAAFTLLLLPVSLNAAARMKHQFNGSLSVRSASHAKKPYYTASQRADLNAQQKSALNANWRVSAGVNAWYENVYNYAQDSYSDQIRREDSQDVRPSDTYAEYKAGAFSARAGYQQIVWGETFGNSPADVVNPRDLRDGPGAEPSQSRRSLAMLSAKYIGPEFFIEALTIPKPEFNMLPLPGSDFAPVDAAHLGFRSITIEREKSANYTESGARVGYSGATADLAVFFFDHLDRSPCYEAGPLAPGGDLLLRERHARVQSLGVTAAKDWEGFVARFEAVHTADRWLPVRAFGTVLQKRADEDAAVLSVDLPPWRRINFSAQVSNSHYTAVEDYLFRPQNQTYAAGRALASIGTSSTLELALAHSLTDRGFRAQAEFMVPLGSYLEGRIGAQIYGGPGTSELGRMEEGSRAYISLKAFTSGFKLKP